MRYQGYLWESYGMYHSKIHHLSIANRFLYAGQLLPAKNEHQLLFWQMIPQPLFDPANKSHKTIEAALRKKVLVGDALGSSTGGNKSEDSV